MLAVHQFHIDSNKVVISVLILDKSKHFTDCGKTVVWYLDLFKVA